MSFSTIFLRKLVLDLAGTCSDRWRKFLTIANIFISGQDSLSKEKVVPFKISFSTIYNMSFFEINDFGPHRHLFGQVAKIPLHSQNTYFRTHCLLKGKLSPLKFPFQWYITWLFLRKMILDLTSTSSDRWLKCLKTAKILIFGPIFLRESCPPWNFLFKYNMTSFEKVDFWPSGSQG